VLSASVTFLSLPGLDAFSRTTGMVAILFAAFSMAATVVAIFRHKADLERPISQIGIEGMMVITVRGDAFKKKIDLFIISIFLLMIYTEANCYSISTTGSSGLFNHSVHHWHCFILL
jgi:hypothetical protein